jgi:hypothetical protein
MARKLTFRNTKEQRFLASDGNRRKCSAPAFTPAFLKRPTDHFGCNPWRPVNLPKSPGHTFRMIFEYYMSLQYSFTSMLPDVSSAGRDRAPDHQDE